MHRIPMFALLILSSACWADGYGIQEKITMPKKVCNDPSCWATYFGASSNVYMAGGVCSDDPLYFIQINGRKLEGSPDIERFEFSDVCEKHGRDEKLFDYPPTSFSCRLGSGVMLSGATYNKTRNIQVKSVSPDRVDDRVYLYDCVNECAKAPAKIIYVVGDCG